MDLCQIKEFGGILFQLEESVPLSVMKQAMSTIGSLSQNTLFRLLYHLYYFRFQTPCTLLIIYIHIHFKIEAFTLLLAYILTSTLHSGELQYTSCMTFLFNRQIDPSNSAIQLKTDMKENISLATLGISNLRREEMEVNDSSTINHVI